MFDIKKGDTRHAIQAVLKKKGVPLDLAGVQVRFTMAHNGRIVIDQPAQQTTVLGEVWYVFLPGQTDTVGIHNYEFHVTYEDGKTEVFPNKGTLQLRINDRVGG